MKHWRYTFSHHLVTPYHSVNSIQNSNIHKKHKQLSKLHKMWRQAVDVYAFAFADRDLDLLPSFVQNCIAINNTSNLLQTISIQRSMATKWPKSRFFTIVGVTVALNFDHLTSKSNQCIFALKCSKVAHIIYIFRQPKNRKLPVQQWERHKELEGSPIFHEHWGQACVCEQHVESTCSHKCDLSITGPLY